MQKVKEGGLMNVGGKLNMRVLIKYLRLIGLISLILYFTISFLTSYVSIGYFFLIIAGGCFAVAFTYLIMKLLFSKYINL